MIIKTNKENYEKNQKKEPFGSYIYLQRIFTRNSEPSSLIIYASYTNIYKKQINFVEKKEKICYPIIEFIKA